MPKREEPAYGRETYFEESPGIPSSPREVWLKLSHRRLALHSDRGVFSYDEIDDGTRVLLEVAPDPPPDGDLLDGGCGYGPIAVALATRCPGRQIWAIDINERALSLARMNMARHGLNNVKVLSPEALPESAVFAAIYSNPPVRVGKEGMRELMVSWLTRLRPHGRAYWVVKKNLGADSLADWLTELGYETTRYGSKRGYRVLESMPLKT